jgi:hypothetical protein
MGYIYRECEILFLETFFKKMIISRVVVKTKVYHVRR